MIVRSAMIERIEPFAYGYLNSDSDDAAMRIADGIYALCKYAPATVDPEIGLAVFGALILYFFGRELCMLFIGDVPAVLAYCDDYMLIKVIFFVALAPIFVLRNSVQGLGYSLPAMLGGVIELFARSLTAIFFAENLFILYMGGPIAWVAAALLFFIIYPIVIRRLSHSPDVLAAQRTPQKIT